MSAAEREKLAPTASMIPVVHAQEPQAPYGAEMSGRLRDYLENLPREAQLLVSRDWLLKPPGPSNRSMSSWAKQASQETQKRGAFIAIVNLPLVGRNYMSRFLQNVANGLCVPSKLSTAADEQLPQLVADAIIKVCLNVLLQAA